MSTPAQKELNRLNKKAAYERLHSADPYAYTELHNIVDNGHYLNLSKARAHFGIEPMTDTVSEVVMLKESYKNLCYKIAVILLCYRKFLNALNEIQP